MPIGVEAVGAGGVSERLGAMVGAAAIALSAGIISGLAGVEGGVIMVPAMVFLLDIGQHAAEGTSLVAKHLHGSRRHAGEPQQPLRRVEGRVAPSPWGAILAPIAATLAQRIPADTLARIFAGWLILIAIRTLIKSYKTSRE